MRINYSSRLRQVVRVLGCGLSVAMVLVPFLAYPFGLSEHARLGWKKTLLLVVGVVWLFGLAFGPRLSRLAGISPWLARLWQWLRQSWNAHLDAPMPWPTAAQAAIAAAAAVLVTGVDIVFSRALGLLSQPPYYDGIAYLLNAKSAYYMWGTSGTAVGDLLLKNLAPLWQGLMLLHFRILGEGEWQAYTIRFWPILLLLLLVLWVVGRRIRPAPAFAAVLFTALLPAVSVGLRSSGWEYLHNNVLFGYEWYLADLRPDLLFSVLMLWAMVPLIEHRHGLSGRIWLWSGVGAALAILTKPSAAAMVLYAWGLAVLYVCAVSRRGFAETAATGFVFALLPAGAMTVPWIAVGGAALMINYVTLNLTVYQSLWLVPNRSLRSEVLYYWHLFPYHMGHVESWGLLAFGGLVLIWLLRRRRAELARPVAYLGLGLALYLLVTITPNKNYFIGMPYFLLLWLSFWSALAAFASAREGARLKPVMLWTSLGYAALVIGIAVVAMAGWPAQERLAGPENREVTRRIAQDLRHVLNNRDCFVSSPGWGYPAALQYYMVDTGGGYPEYLYFSAVTDGAPSELIRNRAAKCKAVLVFSGDTNDISRWIYAPASLWPYFRAIGEWVRQDGGYRQLHTYRLAERTRPSSGYHLTDDAVRGFNLELWVRQERPSPTVIGQEGGK